jgi:hypothetical protein
MRKFDVQGTYRSPYLDHLATQVDYRGAPFRNPELFRPLFEFYKRSYYNKRFSLEWDMYFDTIKGEEAKSHNISGDAWTGLKRDVRPIALEFASKLGYSVKKRRFVKALDNSLVFEIKIDGGGMPHVGSLPIYFNVYAKKDPTNVFGVWFNTIAPGAECYHVPGSSPDRAVLSLKASIELFDSFYESF